MATRSDNTNVPPPPVIPPATVPPVASAARAITDGQQPFITSAVVYRRAKGRSGGRRRGRRGRRKIKTTKGTKQFQRMALGVSDAIYDVTNGFARGLQTHVRRSKRSRRRRKDGLARDFVRNLGRGFQRGFRVGSRAPWDFARRVGTRPLWRTTRRFIIPVINPFFGSR